MSVSIHSKAKRGYFPGSPVVENLPANAGDIGLTPDQKLRSHTPWGNKAHVPQLLIATDTEPMCSEAQALQPEKPPH